MGKTLHTKQNLRNTRPSKTWDELRKGERFLLYQWHPTCYSCQQSGNITIHERGKKDGILTKTNGTYSWSCVIQIYCKRQPSHEMFELITQLNPLEPLIKQFPCQQQSSMKEIIIETRRSGISYKQIYINSIYSCWWITLLHINGTLIMGKLKSFISS